MEVLKNETYNANLTSPCRNRVFLLHHFREISMKTKYAIDLEAGVAIMNFVNYHSQDGPIAT